MTSAAPTTESLAAQRCAACTRETPRLKSAELERFARALPDWKIVKRHHLMRELRFPDFKSALAFTNRVGALAEAEGHHPDLALGWGKVVVSLWTHAIDGLSENDFVLAAKIEQLPREERA